MRMKDKIRLRYSGIAVDDGCMDSYEVAGNIIAFIDFLSLAAKELYGDDAKLNTKVTAFQHGSFGVQFTLDYGGIITSLLGVTSSPKDLYDLIAACFNCWKHLNGEQPTSITKNNDGSFSVKNNYGVINNYSHSVINIIQSQSAANSTSRFVKYAVNDGVSSVHIEQDDHEITSANVDEAKSFGIVLPSNINQTNYSKSVGRRLFKVKTPDLLGKSKWEVILDGKTESVKITHHDWVDSYHKRKFSILPHDSLEADYVQEITYSEDGEVLTKTIELTYIHDVVSPPKNLEMDI
jgi:hypothetical protein